MDVRGVRGNGTHAELLVEAGCEEADLFIAATHADEQNLLAASVAKGVGARRTIARVHHSAYYDGKGLDYERHFNIDHLVCPERSTAWAIARSLRNPGALAVERFARGRIEMQQLPVSPAARAAGSSLADLPLPSSVRIAVVERGGHAFLPEADTVIQEGDVVTLVGEVKVFENARKLLHTDRQRRTRVLVMGGTAQGVWLCRALRARRFSVRLFEPERQRAEELANKLDWVTVVRGDPMDADSLEEESLDQADTFVALTSDDEQNILSAARAKALSVPHSIAVVQRATYLKLIETVGVDRAFSPRATAVSEIQGLIAAGPMRRLATLAAGVADVFEVRVEKEKAAAVGCALRDVAFPPSAVVAAIQRDGEVRVPGADDEIRLGDTCLIVVPANAVGELRRLFAIPP
jgi:trk system potassium uptake protein TrkA